MRCEHRQRHLAAAWAIINIRDADAVPAIAERRPWGAGKHAHADALKTLAMKKIIFQSMAAVVARSARVLRDRATCKVALPGERVNNVAIKTLLRQTGRAGERGGRAKRAVMSAGLGARCRPPHPTSKKEEFASRARECRSFLLCITARGC